MTTICQPRPFHAMRIAFKHQTHNLKNYEFMLNFEGRNVFVKF